MLVRGIQNGRDHDPGFSAKGVTLLSFDLPASYDPARTWSFSRELMDNTRTLKSASIAFASDAPLDRGRMTRYRLPSDPAAREYDAWVVGMSVNFLDVLGMPIVAGRDIEPSDGDDVVLVNQSMARSLWPGESALGKVIVDDRQRRVVGVVRDASVYRLDRVEDVLFRPIDRTRVPVMLIRSSSAAVTQLVKAVAERIDPNARLRVDSVAANVERQLGSLRAIAALAGVLGLIALVLATGRRVQCLRVFRAAADARNWNSDGARRIIDARRRAHRARHRTGDRCGYRRWIGGGDWRRAAAAERAVRGERIRSGGVRGRGVAARVGGGGGDVHPGTTSSADRPDVGAQAGLSAHIRSS
jgi:hypothetical protein